MRNVRLHEIETTTPGCWITVTIDYRAPLKHVARDSGYYVEIETIGRERLAGVDYERKDMLGHPYDQRKLLEEASRFSKAKIDKFVKDAKTLNTVTNAIVRQAFWAFLAAGGPVPKGIHPFGDKP